MQIPDLKTAHELVQQAEQNNPGPWVAHSYNVARAAEYLAGPLRECGWDLAPQPAYILGLLHDIGRREGRHDMRHIIDGYRYLHQMGYEDAARICLTHSFPLQDVQAMSGNWDGTPADETFVSEFLQRTEYDHYDRLIQLCDAIAIPEGFCLIEKRMVDVAMRRGINVLTIEKWKAFFAVKNTVEDILGQPVYSFLPGVVETTFGRS